MKQAFTLIELLVVVLIIGILAAIALPQYQVAVDKTRYTTLMLLVRSLHDAQEMYYLVNGQYAANFEELGTDILPEGFSLSENKITASYPNFAVDMGNGTYVGGYLLSGQGIILNSYLIFLSHSSASSRGRQCWAYGGPSERAKKVCQSISGKSTSDSGGNNYEIWKLN